MTACSSWQRYSTRYTVINYSAKSQSKLLTKPFIKQVRYDREGRRIAEIAEREPRALLQLRKEELEEREKELVEKLEKLRRLRDTLKKRISVEKIASNSSNTKEISQPVSGG